MLETFSIPAPGHGAAPFSGWPLGPGRPLTALVADCLAPATDMKSVLTANGSPLEIGFAAQGGTPRYTLEAASPDTPMLARVGAVHARALRHGLALPCDERFVALQRAAPDALEFGAWLGLRMRGGDVAPKLYIEMPRDLDPQLLQISGHPAWRGLMPRLVGLSDDTDGGVVTELYFGGAPATRGGLSGLLLEAGFYDVRAVPRLFDLLQTVNPGAADKRLACHDVGVSFAHGPDGKLLAISILLYAEQVFGGGPKLRLRVARLFELLGGNPTAYLADTAAAPDPARHGILSLTVTPDGTMAAHIGLSADPLSLNIQQERLI